MSSEKIDDSVASPRPQRLLKTAFLLVASAACGGLAVALWDRRTLAGMRNRAPDPELKSQDDEDAIY